MFYWGQWNLKVPEMCFWQVAGIQTGSFLQSSQWYNVLNHLSGKSSWNSHISSQLSISGQLLSWTGGNVKWSSDTLSLLHDPFDLRFSLHVGKESGTIFFYTAIGYEKFQKNSMKWLHRAEKSFFSRCLHNLVMSFFNCKHIKVRPMHFSKSNRFRYE